MQIDLPKVAKKQGKPPTRLPPIGATKASQISLTVVASRGIRMVETTLRQNRAIFPGIKRNLAVDASTLCLQARKVPKRRAIHKTRPTLSIRGAQGESWWHLAGSAQATQAVPAGGVPTARRLVKDDLDEFALLMAQLRSELGHQEQQLTPLVSRIYVEEERRNRTRLGKTVQSRFGVPLEDLMSSNDVAAQIQAATQQSVALIKGLNAEVLKKVEYAVLDAAQQEQSVTTLSERLRETMGISRSRARLIAKDQTSKFNSTLNKVRQDQLGIDRYVWSTQLDERVRPLHENREGKVFSWNDPPSDGHPGFPPGCRCVAAPFVG
jgi:SPP1 gp7 family putative phage head morphogenesis protein